MELADGTPPDYSAAQTTSYAYDAQGNLSRTTFTDGSSLSYGYDEFLSLQNGCISFRPWWLVLSAR